MKILVVSQYFWPEDFRINDLVNGLAGKGHKVTVLTGKPNYPVGKFFPGYGFFKKNVEHKDGVTIYRVPLIPRGQNNKILLSLNYFSFVFFGMLLGPFYCRQKFDLIFVFSVSPITTAIPARFLGWLRKTPVIIWVQDLWPESLTATGAISNKYILKSVEVMVEWIYKGCGLVLVQSRAFTKSILGFSVPETKIKYFPNSAESIYKAVVNDAQCEGIELLPDGFIVMFAGNIGVAQDFETIIEAARLTEHKSNIHWVILGEGRNYNWLKDEVERLEIAKTFHLLGRYPMEDMPIFFAKADAMLVSLKKAEIFSMTIPSKIQSYMACAKPIIASLEGEGARVIEESGAGISVDIEKPQSLANAVLTMEKMNHEERVHMGVKGLEYYEKNFERTMLLEQLETIMTKVVEG